MDGAGETEQGWGSCMAGTPLYAGQVTLIYTYLLHCLSKAGMIISIFQGRNLRFRVQFAPVCHSAQIPRKMGYTLPRMESTTWRGEHPTESASWVVPSLPHPQTQVSVLF